jgi:hypothetical protein
MARWRVVEDQHHGTGQGAHQEQASLDLEVRAGACDSPPAICIDRRPSLTLGHRHGGADPIRRRQGDDRRHELGDSGTAHRWIRIDDVQLLASGVVMWCSANGETTRVETDGREVRVPLPTYGMWIQDLRGSMWAFTDPTPAGNVVQLSTGVRAHVPSDRHALLTEVLVPETWVWLDQAAADWTLACVDGSSTYFRSGAADSTLLHRVRAGGGVRSKPLPRGPVGPGGGCLAGSLLVGSRPDSVVWFLLPSLRAAGEVPAAPRQARVLDREREPVGLMVVGSTTIRTSRGPAWLAAVGWSALA